MAKCWEKCKYISKSHYNLNDPWSWSARTEDFICEMDASHHHLWGQPELLMWGRVLFSLISRLMGDVFKDISLQNWKNIINPHGPVLIIFHISKNLFLKWIITGSCCFDFISRYTTVSIQNLPLLRELLSPSCCHEQKNAIKHGDEFYYQSNCGINIPKILYSKQKRKKILISLFVQQGFRNLFLCFT